MLYGRFVVIQSKVEGKYATPLQGRRRINQRPTVERFIRRLVVDKRSADMIGISGKAFRWIWQRCMLNRREIDNRSPSVMKFTFAMFLAALLAVPTITKAAPPIVLDGRLDAQYGSAIVTQKLGTSTFKNTETNIDAANGSELDAAYGTISNGVLYLFIAGNIDSGGADSSGNA